MRQYSKEEIQQFYKNLAFLFTWTFVFGTLSDYSMGYILQDIPWWADAILGFFTNFMMLMIAVLVFIDKNIIYQ